MLFNFLRQQPLIVLEVLKFTYKTNQKLHNYYVFTFLNGVSLSYNYKAK